MSESEKGGEQLTPEQKEEARLAELEKIKADNEDLKVKLSEQGETISGLQAAVDGYSRGQSLPERDGGDEELPDPIQDPKKFWGAVDQRLEKKMQGSLKQFHNVQVSIEYARKARDSFFKAFPALKRFEELVDLRTQQYMAEHGNDSLLSTNPAEFQKRAFKAISDNCIETVKGWFGGKFPQEGEEPPAFDAGGGAGGDKGGRREGPAVIASEEEHNDQQTLEYLKEKREARNKRK